MIIVEAIKPGPKPNKPDGTPDRRRRVTPYNKPNHRIDISRMISFVSDIYDGYVKIVKLYKGYFYPL
ncbi:hypothetical protein [Cellulophaga baltica]|uniref:Uncharacterized protein n=1 Tax=Cellulophaga baltica TaxID=76594 RepID=A0A1G7GFU5_9FLAO|nr:hypothetical protein [Cellulophaga baltica]SDE86971.1 hypothetical protein SAMN04487992_104352 [Cellulophaga baltica]